MVVWRAVHVGPDGDGLVIGGVAVWEHVWALDERAAAGTSSSVVSRADASIPGMRDQGSWSCHSFRGGGIV